jgi:hypothetical protein
MSSRKRLLAALSVAAGITGSRASDVADGHSPAQDRRRDPPEAAAADLRGGIRRGDRLDEFDPMFQDNGAGNRRPPLGRPGENALSQRSSST